VIDGALAVETTRRFAAGVRCQDEKFPPARNIPHLWRIVAEIIDLSRALPAQPAGTNDAQERTKYYFTAR
jgi:hypothetical protein